MTSLRVHDAFVAHSQSSTQPRHVPQWRALSLGGHRIGPARAQVTITEFSDFQCPFCRIASHYLDDAMRRHPGQIAVVYRHFPIHKYSRQAAVASECAGRQSDFQALHDLLFAEPDSIGVSGWATLAHRAGVKDSLAFAECMRQSATNDVVSRDSVAARVLGIQGTPTFLINDLMVSGFPGDSVMDQYILDEAGRRSGQ
jgi:protein-disulfide isomerase